MSNSLKNDPTDNKSTPAGIDSMQTCLLKLLYDQESFKAWCKFYDEYRLVKVTCKIQLKQATEDAMSPNIALITTTGWDRNSTYTAG